MRGDRHHERDHESQVTSPQPVAVRRTRCAQEQAEHGLPDQQGHGSAGHPEADFGAEGELRARDRAQAVHHPQGCGRCAEPFVGPQPAGRSRPVRPAK
jgi:hypothetical protein